MWPTVEGRATPCRRPQSKQVPPWRPRSSVALIDPLRTSGVHRSTRERAVPESTTHNPWKSAVRKTDMPDPLLDHLIGGGQQRFRDGEAEHFGGLEVDDHIKLPPPENLWAS